MLKHAVDPPPIEDEGDWDDQQPGQERRLVPCPAVGTLDTAITEAPWADIPGAKFDDRTAGFAWLATDDDPRAAWLAALCWSPFRGVTRRRWIRSCEFPVLDGASPRPLPSQQPRAKRSCLGLLVHATAQGRQVQGRFRLVDGKWTAAGFKGDGDASPDGVGKTEVDERLEGIHRFCDECTLQQSRWFDFKHSIHEGRSLVGKVDAIHRPCRQASQR